MKPAKKNEYLHVGKRQLEKATEKNIDQSGWRVTKRWSPTSCEYIANVMIKWFNQINKKRNTSGVPNPI